jgi:hypothetical protein
MATQWSARCPRINLSSHPLRARGVEWASVSAEQQVADEADRRALNLLATRRTIADSQAAPAFQENHKRLKAERIAREAGLKAKGK